MNAPSEAPKEIWIERDVHNRFNFCTKNRTESFRYVLASEHEAEIARLNKWADGFSDAQLKERAACQAVINELNQQIATLQASNEAMSEELKPYREYQKRLKEMVGDPRVCVSVGPDGVNSLDLNQNQSELGK